MERENVFSAGFGPVGNTEKKALGPIMSNFLGQFFHVFRGKKKSQIFFKNTLASALKSCIKCPLQKFFL